jgi:hypothetical protein
MLLIETDKRGSEWATRLAYSSDDDEPFSVPENLFIIGMMNTADRSLSLVDYALRRRFAFITLAPEFSSAGFRSHLIKHGGGEGLVDRVVGGMTDLNAAISDDKVNLGPGFRIGHSFFVPNGTNVSDQWYEKVIDTEIRPLLEEYWFDEPARAESWCERLLSGS